MAETTPATQRWIGRTGFVLLALLVISFQLVPLDTTPRRWAPPDLLLCLTLLWTVRRPDYAPVVVVAMLFLLADFLFQRPPGLMAALVVMATEAIRRRAGSFRSMPFLVEWLSVALVVVLIAFAQRVLLAVTLLDLPPLPLTMIEMTLTVLAYPVLAGLAYLLFGISRRAPGEVDTLGHRI